MKAILFGLHCEKRYINIYIQYNTIQYNEQNYYSNTIHRENCISVKLYLTFSLIF